MPRETPVMRNEAMVTEAIESCVRRGYPARSDRVAVEMGQCEEVAC